MRPLQGSIANAAIWLGDVLPYPPSATLSDSRISWSRTGIVPKSSPFFATRVDYRYYAQSENRRRPCPSS